MCLGSQGNGGAASSPILFVFYSLLILKDLCLEVEELSHCCMGDMKLLREWISFMHFVSSDAAFVKRIL